MERGGQGEGRVDSRGGYAFACVSHVSVTVCLCVYSSSVQLSQAMSQDTSLEAGVPDVGQDLPTQEEGVKDDVAGADVDVVWEEEEAAGMMGGVERGGLGEGQGGRELGSVLGRVLGRMLGRTLAILIH